MPRPKVSGLESYEDIPISHPQRRKIQNRNAQRTFRRKRTALHAQSLTETTSVLPTGSQEPTAINKSVSNVEHVYTTPWDPSHRGDVTADDVSFLDNTPGLANFFDDVDLDDQNIQDPGQGPLHIMRLDKQPAGRPLDWQPTKTHTGTTSNESLLPKSKDNQQLYRSSTSLDLLNSPCPTENWRRASDHTLERPSPHDEPQEVLNPCAQAISTKPPNSSGSGNAWISIMRNTPRRESIQGQQNQASSSGTAMGSIPASQPEYTISTAKPISLSEPAILGRRQSVYSSSEDDASDVPHASSDSVFVWRHLIHTCCENGHLSLVQELLSVGLDIDKKDSAGNTPLHIAAGTGHVDIMRYLLEKGCDVNAINNTGWTAAHLASIKGHGGCLRLLLENNVSPWVRVNIPGGGREWPELRRDDCSISE